LGGGAAFATLTEPIMELTIATRTTITENDTASLLIIGAPY
jgi:hypothetical protein